MKKIFTSSKIYIEKNLVTYLSEMAELTQKKNQLFIKFIFHMDGPGGKVDQEMTYFLDEFLQDKTYNFFFDQNNSISMEIEPYGFDNKILCIQKWQGVDNME